MTERKVPKTRASTYDDNGAEILIPEEGVRFIPNGGDVVFMPGLPGAPLGVSALGNPGCIRFHLPDGTEQLRLAPDGKIFVKGEEVAYRKDVVDAFATWVYSALLFEAPSTNPAQANHAVVLGKIDLSKEEKP